MSQEEPCCSSCAPPDPSGAASPTVRTTTSRLSVGDILGGWAVRWSWRRMDYRVDPGLYSINDPDRSSPVLVTSNYKLTFDAVRRELSNVAAWILVLDTKGVNVWCAAGKGTFGTGELLNRLELTGVAQVVDHRTLVLPQMGATGVDAQEIRRAAGWKVAWGPVFARDIPAYLESGLKKTQAMRTVTFDLRDRLVLVPVELVQAAKWFPIFAALAAIFALPFDGSYLSRFSGMALLLVSSIFVGAFAFPVLLPWLPLRAFGLKGLVLGTAANVFLGLAASRWWGTPVANLVAAALLATALTVWLAMNFTGSTTFTSQTGATLEVKVALKPLVAAAATGFVFAAAILVRNLVA